MKREVKILIGVVVAVIALGLVVAGATFAQTATPNKGGNYSPGTMIGNGTNQGGMMGNTTNQGGMMGGTNNTPSAQPLTIGEAKEAAVKYLATVSNKTLVIDEIMLFDNNAYVAIKDSSTGVGAFELLVNPGTKQAFPEFGPNMMWNLLYSPMSGNNSYGISQNNYSSMMGNGWGGMMGGMMSGQEMMSGLGKVNPVTYQPGKMTIEEDEALKAAQAYLDKSYPGVQVNVKADEFPGYYTIDVMRDGKISGMLSVNGFNGQVWYHTWHGKFLEIVDYGS